MENNKFNVVAMPSKKRERGEILIPRDMEESYAKNGKGDVIVLHLSNNKNMTLKVKGISDCDKVCYMNRLDMKQLGTEHDVDLVTLLIQ